MAYQFQKHYTRDEARRLLPQVRLWLKRIGELQAELQVFETRLSDYCSPAPTSGANW